jgi:hypothetical protein
MKMRRTKDPEPVQKVGQRVQMQGLEQQETWCALGRVWFWEVMHTKESDILLWRTVARWCSMTSESERESERVGDMSRGLCIRISRDGMTHLKSWSACHYV